MHLNAKPLGYRHLRRRISHAVRRALKASASCIADLYLRRETPLTDGR